MDEIAASACSNCFSGLKTARSRQWRKIHAGSKEERTENGEVLEDDQLELNIVIWMHLRSASAPVHLTPL